LIGNCRNGGSDWRRKETHTASRCTDFDDKTLGKVVPYGIYDVGANTGWVSLGITSDTAEFAVASIRTRHLEVEQDRAPHVLPHHAELAGPTAEEPRHSDRADRQHHECALDARTYEKGIRISNDQMRQSKAIKAVIVEGLLTSKTGSS
jgi:hypothetical protein